MDLNRWISGVLGRRVLVPKNQSSTAGSQDLSSTFVVGGIKAECFRRTASSNEGLDDSPGGPRLVAAWLENDRDLQRDCRKPERIDSRGVAGHHQTQALSSRIKTDACFELSSEATLDNA